MGYLKETLKGMGWMGALRGGTRFLAFVKIAILARLLTPNEFGLFGIASLALAFLEIITETGVNIFLIQEKAKLEGYNNSAWIVSILRGFVIFGILVVFTPLVSSFFKTPESTKTLFLISLVPLMRGFINPAIVKFQKELFFAKEFYLRLFLFAIDTLVAVSLAIITKSAFSLVFGLIISASIEVLLSHLFIKPRPALRLDRVKVKQVIGRGKWFTAAGVFNYLFENVDDALVGRLLSTGSLGIYQVAHKISSLPITEVSDVVIKVTFPVYVKISGDIARLKRAFIKALFFTGILTIPFGLTFFFFTKEIVLFLLGEQWRGSIVVVKILSFFGVIRAITNTTFPLLLALKKQNYVMLITLTGLFGLGISIIPLIKIYGITGAAFSALLGSMFSLPVALLLTFHLLSKIKKNI